jgi:hypothetical protein
MFVGLLVLFITIYSKNDKIKLCSLNNRLDNENMTIKYKFYKERLYKILESKNISIYYKTSILNNEKEGDY